MKPLGIEEIRRVVRGRWLARGQAVTVQRVSTDSRSAQAGDLFVALKGPRHDGADFLQKAAAAGCLAAIVSRDARLDKGVSHRFAGGIVTVADTTQALGELGAYHRGLVRATVVAITGSNGKTTVKRMIHHILSGRLRGAVSPKSFNNKIGVPLTLLAAEPGDDYLLCEIGTSGLGEVAELARMVRPSIAVITSVAQAHLEGLGTVEKVAAEKASLLGEVARQGLAVVWGDSPELEKALRAYGCRMVRFGQSERAELRLTGYEPLGQGQRFQINGRFWHRLPLPGRHNATNALAAIAVARRFGFDQQAAGEALSDYKPAEMRLQWVELDGLTVINDAYNANPASVAAAADVLADCQAKRRVMFVGDMRELGGQSKGLHLATGRSIAAKGVDLLIGVGRLGRYIAIGAAKGGAETATFNSVTAAGRAMGELLRRGDAVMIKGSRAMKMERLIEAISQSLAPRPKARKRSKK